ncbi:hypothetical protein PFICI_12423 [Pestalotiopsis fici W106-1]|uniref:Uncharacterized protein n=1 Tax=Pestalotiopsis fici (strain W106-1 / CGMCC3.15140) TaxID=1229662 RepID=W3WNV8_PESFW|nr:uncharacterized protein PFICI_12423 [Pestalotiopsis fici W106-1]ETS75479.1 hypothetical protein PFICI_12423 [Pestalotiopsis fici W106-1]
MSSALDWLDIIDRETHSDLSSPLSSLAHSSALKVFPSRRASDAAPSEAGLNLPHISLIRYAGLDQEAQNGWSTGERYLLNHFLQSVARSMSMAEDKYNPFIRLIVPLAFESTGVRNALVALSATHLSKIYPDFEKDHLLHRNLALEDLKWRLESPESVISNLTTTLLLCLSEVCECHSKRWLLYLYGARALLPQVVRGAPGALEDFLIDLYNYICCVSSVTSPDVPHVWGKRFGLYRSNATHALFGCEPGLYMCLARINRFLHQRSRLKTRESLDALQCKVLAMEAKLQNWESLRDIESEEKAAACTLRWAMILRLREVKWPSLETASSQIQEPVSNINLALSLIRPGSQAESHLLFPMFMAGVGSISKASRLFIEYRIHVAEKTNGFGSVNAVHRLLDILWRSENNGGEAGAWQDIVAGEMPGLVLF